MTKSNQDIPGPDDETFISGDSAILRVKIENPDGTPRDISNADIEFALAIYPGGTIEVEKSDADSALKVTDGPEGELEIELEADETAGLGSREGRDYYYEIEVSDAYGTATVTTGTWQIQADTA